MRSRFGYLWALLTALALASDGQCASIFDIFKRQPASNETTTASGALITLSQEQIVSGLKEALGKGVQQAVFTLGRTNGFLTNFNVRIPMPQSLQRVEKTLRALRQDRLADEFVAAMNHAAEQAVPEAAAVLSDSVRQMTIADAKAILIGTNNAATEYFRRTSETNLYGAFLPIVKRATEQAGVTAAYKRMTDKATGGLGNLGALSEALLGKDIPDLDDYVTRKALDGLFVKIAEEEKQIRENPLARTTALLQKVFGVLGK